jgi:hypothetical protein
LRTGLRLGVEVVTLSGAAARHDRGERQSPGAPDEDTPQRQAATDRAEQDRRQTRSRSAEIRLALRRATSSASGPRIE